jgi:hypothetical protein
MVSSSLFFILADQNSGVCAYFANRFSLYPHTDRMLEGWYFGERDTKDDGQLMEVPLYDQRGSLADRASGVQRNSNANAIRDARANESATEDLRGLEKTMKYGLFCLTFMYFRALHTLCKERATWDGSNDLVTLRHGPPLSEERKKIIQEEKNAEFRRKRIECVMQKAKAGEERWRQWSERERLEKVGLSVNGRKWKKFFIIILNVSPLALTF